MCLYPAELGRLNWVTLTQNNCFDKHIVLQFFFPHAFRFSTFFYYVTAIYHIILNTYAGSDSDRKFLCVCSYISIIIMFEH